MSERENTNISPWVFIVCGVAGFVLVVIGFLLDDVSTRATAIGLVLFGVWFIGPQEKRRRRGR